MTDKELRKTIDRLWAETQIAHIEQQIVNARRTIKDIAESGDIRNKLFMLSYLCSELQMLDYDIAEFAIYENEYNGE